MLAACAFPEPASRGRRYPEPRHPYRGEFQRDRDRAIHARAFRRLESKTQVFDPRYSDHFRNRLTHTLEVAQISRTVAGAVGLNQDLVEALALAHDLGHPPFGHAGERALDAMMRRFGDEFDHNLHALRLVEELETVYIGFPGLNLTWEVREGLVKHSRRYSAASHPELAGFELDLFPPVEAQIIDLTDEVAYLCADLDDGHAAGLLPVAAIAAAVPVFDRLWQGVRRQAPSAPVKLQFSQTLRRLLDFLVSGLVAHLREVLPQFPSVAAVRHHPALVVSLPPEVEAERRRLKDFLYASLYRHEQLQRENERAAALVTALFERYLAQPAALPAAYLARTASTPAHRVICDYLAGMTDRYLRALATADDSL